MERRASSPGHFGIYGTPPLIRTARMLPKDDKLAQPDSPETDLSEIEKKVGARTPALLLAGRSGPAYRTNTQLELREAHAAARDAVRAELDLSTTFGADFVKRWGLFEVCTQAT